MWHKPCRTFHPWCLCIKTRCLFGLIYENRNWRPCWPLSIGVTPWCLSHSSTKTRNNISSMSIVTENEFSRIVIGTLVNSVASLGSTLYSDGSFVRRFFSPKPFEVAMLRRTYGPKVLYSEVPLLRKLLCSEDSIFRKAPHYMDSMLRRFFSPKFI